MKNRPLLTLETGKIDPAAADRERIKGFTFIEAFFVIIIIGILIGVSLPSFKKTLNNLRYDNFSRELQALMNYLRERAVVEREIVYLNIDNDKKEFWAQIRNAEGRLKTYRLPEGVEIETEKNQILFYPDGQVEKVTIKVINPGGQKISLTTKGVFSGVKLLPQE